MSVEPEFVAGTLAWCNERRAEKGMEPLDRLPKGVRNDPLSCPCGKATGLHVGSVSYGGGEEEDLSLPAIVREFVSAFDCGELPQYDEEAA